MESTKDNSTGAPVFSDDGSGWDPAAQPATRRRWPWVAGITVIAGVAVAAGLFLTGNLASAPTPAGTAGGGVAPVASETTSITPGSAPPTSAAASATEAAASLPASPSATAAPAPSAATAQPAGDWRTFTSANGKISFDYPAQWTVGTPPGAAASPAVDVDVADETGMVVASLHYGPSGGIGGACQNPVPYKVLDSVELALPYNKTAADIIAPRFAFRALQESGRVTASYGITSSAAGKDGTTCMFYNVVSGPSESPLYSFADAFQVNAGSAPETGNRRGAKTFPSMDAALAYMQTPEYLNAKRMITSLKINAG